MWVHACVAMWVQVDVAMYWVDVCVALLVMFYVVLCACLCSNVKTCLCGYVGTYMYTYGYMYVNMVNMNMWLHIAQVRVYVARLVHMLLLNMLKILFLA